MCSGNDHSVNGDSAHDPSAKDSSISDRSAHQHLAQNCSPVTKKSVGHDCSANEHSNDEQSEQLVSVYIC